MIVSTIGIFFLYIETPMFYKSKGKISSSIHQIIKLGKRNGVDLEFKEILKTLELEELCEFDEIELRSSFTTKQQIGNTIKRILSIFSNWERLKVTIPLSVQSISLYLIYQAASLNVSSLGFSKIQYNMILLSICQIIGYILISYFLKRIPRKPAAIVVYSLIIACSALLALVNLLDLKSKSEELYRYNIIFDIFVINMCVSIGFSIFFAHAAELYSSEVRASGIGVTVLLGKLVGSFNSFISDFSTSLGFNVLVLCCIPSIAALPLTFLLRETIGDKKMI